MFTQNARIILVFVIAVLGVGYFIVKDSPDAVENVNVVPEYGTYTDETYRFAFSYPTGRSGYTISEEPIGSEDDGLKKILVLESAETQNQEIPQGGEAAPTLSILILKNEEAQNVRNWAQNNILYSGFDRLMSEVTDITVGGKPAIRYISDGLYATQTVVVGNDSDIIVILGPFIDKQSRTYRDFTALVDSVTFTQ